MQALAALDRLRAGNARFVADTPAAFARTGAVRRGEVLEGQTPFAVVLGCSDSRVPVEMIFDQGVGDLFVIRVAGNVVAPSQLASAEFAVEQFGTRLVVVLGHSGCGAVQSALDALRVPTAGTADRGDPQPAVRRHRSIIDRIRPAVTEAMAKAPDAPRDAIVERAVRANVRRSARALRRDSVVFESLLRGRDFLVVGAEYSLATGAVDFFDVPKATG